MKRPELRLVELPRNKSTARKGTVLNERERKRSGWTSFGTTAVVHVLMALLLLILTIPAHLSSGPPVLFVGGSKHAGKELKGKDKREKSKKTQTLNRVLETRPVRHRAVSTSQAREAERLPQPDIRMTESEAVDTTPLENALMESPAESEGGGAVGFFGTRGGGLRIVLVIDTSTSMRSACGPEGIARLRQEIMRTVFSLNAKARFNLICFGDLADGYRRKPVQAEIKFKEAAMAFLDGYYGSGPFKRTRTEDFGKKGVDPTGMAYHPITPDQIAILDGTGGGSRIDLGILAAFKQRASSIFLITDGAPRVSIKNRRLSDDQIVGMLLQESDRIYSFDRPRINCVSVNGEGAGILKRIAGTFTGTYREVRLR